MQTLTPNQVVAFNLLRARTLRGLTQEQAATLLEPHLGEHWSVAVFSAAERSVTGKRIREFDADTLWALTRAFDLPVNFFLVPPPGVDRVHHPGVAAERGDNPEQLTERLVGLAESLEGLLEHELVALDELADRTRSLAMTLATAAKVSRAEAAGEHQQPATVEKKK